MITRIYETKPVKIGKHFWRIAVTESARYNGDRQRMTHYEWRPSALDGRGLWHFKGAYYGEETFLDAAYWPRYDFNDGRYLGLPKSLAKLYIANKSDIERALA